PAAVEADQVDYYFTGRRLRPFPSWCLPDDPARQDPDWRREAQAAIRTVIDARQTPFISQPLTWRQICERYPDEWVCLAEGDHVNAHVFEFRTGRVIGHGKHGRDPIDQCKPFRDQYEEICHYFTGSVRAPLYRIPVYDDHAI